MRKRRPARMQERVIEPSASGVRWFQMYEALGEYASAQAYWCVWDETDERWEPDTTIAKRTIYSTAQGITAEAGDFVPCWFNMAGRGKWEVIAAPAAAGGIPFRNDSGETMPAYGVGRIVTPGSVTVGGVEYVTLAKPNATFHRKYLVNTGSAIAAGATGLGTWLDEGGRVLYDDADLPAQGQSWGPQDGSWELKKWRYGFTIIGNPTGGATDLVRAWQEEVNGFIGKTDGTHNKSATGTISVYDGNRVDSSINVASVYNLFANVGSGKWVDVEWRGGTWYLTSAEC